jgi:hypothetical protein
MCVCVCARARARDMGGFRCSVSNTNKAKVRDSNPCHVS